MFQIGQFSRLGGISAKQLRAYDELALFRPVWVDPSSGYRYYSPAQLPELRRILALRQLGMPLEEIGALVRGGDLRSALDRRRDASVIHRGPYGGVAAARAMLLRWVEAAGLVTAGPMRTLYLQFGAEPELRLPPGWVVERDEQFVTELQQPIQ